MEDYNIKDASDYFKEKLNFTISCSRLKAKIDRNDRDIVIIDVRDRESFDKGRIQGQYLLMQII